MKWSTVSHSVALLLGGITNQMTISAAFGSCFNFMVMLRVASNNCDTRGPCLKRCIKILRHLCGSVAPANRRALCFEEMHQDFEAFVRKCCSSKPPSFVL